MEPDASEPEQKEASPSVELANPLFVPCSDPGVSLADSSGEEERIAAEIVSMTDPDRECLTALLALHKQHKELFKAYSEEQSALEHRYHNSYKQLYMQRRGVLEQHPQMQGFWLKALKRHWGTKRFIYKKDEKLLKYLVDIRCVDHLPNDDTMLEFEFAENPYFSDRILTKLLISRPANGLEEAIGCEIHWKGKNFTEKQVMEKGVMLTVPRPSFFSFFDTHTASTDSEMLSDDGSFFDLIHQFLIPNALRSYFGADDSSGDDEDRRPPWTPSVRQKKS